MAAGFIYSDPNIDETPALFNEDGSPVAFSNLGIDMFNGKLPDHTSTLVLGLKPGQELEKDPLVLNDWYDIKTPGNYHLVMLRHVIKSVGYHHVTEGDIVSNLMTIQIVK